MPKLKLLKRYFGYSRFRPGQEELIDKLISGGDVLGIMPTGGGKSLCYQLPALLRPGLTLVISPLISLMKDQVAALTQANIPAAFINSTLSQEEYRDICRGLLVGKYKLLYIAPERLTVPGWQSLARKLNISLIAVDEAHCISQWGPDFRPSYMRIPEFIQQLNQRPPVGAFTATATPQVRRDIIKWLELKEPLILTTGFDRPNLFFQVSQPHDKTEFLIQFIQQRQQQSGIVYCSTRNGVERICSVLQGQGWKATRYHAGLSDQERRSNQEDFIYDRARIMVATNAFGMGIDKSNVSYVVHYNMPKDLESYYQEAGRAGRDGAPAHCLLLYSGQDVVTARYLIQNQEKNPELTPKEQQELEQRELRRLHKMIDYCQTASCLRHNILSYFGERPKDTCGNCSNCQRGWVYRDMTVVAQKILSSIYRAEKRCGHPLDMETVVQLLRGSRHPHILELGLEYIPSYGLLREVPEKEIEFYVKGLIDQGYIKKSAEEIPTLRLTVLAKPVLVEHQPVTMRVPRDSSLPELKPEHKSEESSQEKRIPPEELLQALKRLRSRLAVANNIPPYMIFSNNVLANIAISRPQNIREFLEVSGVSENAAARWGASFLAAIDDYRRSRSRKR